MKTTRNYKTTLWVLFALFLLAMVLLVLKIGQIPQQTNSLSSLLTGLFLIASVVIILGIFIFRISIKIAGLIQNDIDLQQKEDDYDHNINQTDKAFSEQMAVRKILEEEMSAKIFKGFTEIKDPAIYCELFLSNLAKEFEIVQGMFFLHDQAVNGYKMKASYAFFADELPPDIHSGIGLSGQVVKDKKTMIIRDIPEKFGKIISGLGSGKPAFLGIFPAVSNNNIEGIVELATFIEITPETQAILEHLINKAIQEITPLQN